MSGADELLDTLADMFVERVADRLLERLDAVQDSNGTPNDRLLSLDEFVALLPATKSAVTWKRWAYERLRRDELPGAVKLAGSWFLKPSEALPWLEERDK